MSPRLQRLLLRDFFFVALRGAAFFLLLALLDFFVVDVRVVAFFFRDVLVFFFFFAVRAAFANASSVGAPAAPFLRTFLPPRFSRSCALWMFAYNPGRFFDAFFFFFVAMVITLMTTARFGTSSRKNFGKGALNRPATKGQTTLRDSNLERLCVTSV